ncbi:MAG TPA: family 2A encapsulin nanocompartment cargo protein cysteine desulfurase [Polyangiaceae bacterium]|nr:family 2A encapsulin nanocompartment cargo protein cysteine desulfurase [Polyangiaceae bacterium]
MSTSDPLSQAPTPQGLDVSPANFAQDLQRWANQFFSGVPGPGLDAPSGVPSGAAAPAPPPAVSVAPAVGPSALAMGAGGASPAVSAPPIPGVLKAPPLSTSPVPKESDLRTAPAMFAENLGTTPLALAGPAEPVEQDSSYFLGLAGLPGSPSSASALGAPVSGVPEGGAPSLGSLPWPAAPLPGAEPPGVPAGRAASPTQAARFAPDIEASTASQHRLFDPHAVKRDFPILKERVNGRELVWLDNAATTQKPRAVIDRLRYFYEHENSNIHRAAHALAARATDAYEAARETTRRFLNAPSTKNIVFARGTTETINLVAQAWGRRHLTAGDEIVITWLEHHANIVPWQMLCREKGARLCVAPVDDSGQVILEEYERLLGPRTRLVAFGQVSNALGTIVPAREMVEIAHRYGARVLVDGAQAVSHLRVDVQALDCDFYCFSGHKIFGPTGIGVLYGKSDALESMPPWQGGGNMIDSVTFEKTTYRPPPDRFEAGTGNIADAVGLGAALDYVSGLGLENIARHEHDLLVYATERLQRLPGLRLFGTAAEKAGVLSFLLDGQRAEDVGEALDQEGIAVRAGHHCAQPILRRFGVEATVRASLAPYNTREDIDALVDALSRLQAGQPRRGQRLR